MRELLTLLRAHPQYYVKAAQQACPDVPFDYLQIDPMREGTLNKASERSEGAASTRGGGAYSTRPQVSTQNRSTHRSFNRAQKCPSPTSRSTPCGKAPSTRAQSALRELPQRVAVAPTAHGPRQDSPPQGANLNACCL